MENGSTPPIRGRCRPDPERPSAALGAPARRRRARRPQRRQGDRDRRRRRTRRRGGDRRRGRERGGRAGDGAGTARARSSKRPCRARWRAMRSSRRSLEAMDSELVDEVWRRLLASDAGPAAGRADRRGARGAGRDQRPGGRPARGHRPHDRQAGPPPRRPLRADRAPAPLPPPARGRHATAPAPSAAAWRWSIDGVFVNLSFTAIAAIVALVESTLRRRRRRHLEPRDRRRLDHLAGARRPLPGRLLVAGRADAGDALPRHQARAAAACRCGARSGGCSASASR